MCPIESEKKELSHLRNRRLEAATQLVERLEGQNLECVPFAVDQRQIPIQAKGLSANLNVIEHAHESEGIS